MRFQPIDSRTHLCDGRHFLGQGKGGLHTTHYYRFNYLKLIFMRIEDQLIMHLQEHPGFKSRPGEFIMNADHSQLDHIGCSPLDRAVDSISLGEPADGEVGRVDIL